MRLLRCFALSMVLMTVMGLGLAEEGTILDLRGESTPTLEDIQARLDAAPGTTMVDLTGVSVSPQVGRELVRRFPDVSFLWTMNAFGRTLTPETRTLDLQGTPVKDFELLEAVIACFPNLEEVLMYDSKPNLEQRDKLQAAFPDLFFGFTISFQNGGYTIRTDVTAFSTLKNGGPPYLYNHNTWWVKHCKYLQALDLGHNMVTDLSFLYEVPQLKVLILADNSLEDITPIGCLTELEYLEMFINNITDISALKNCVRLKDLNLSFNKELADITALYDLPDLERLWLTMDKEIPQAQIDEFRARHPNTELVVRSNGATGEILLDDDTKLPGWRQHPHYPVIYHMFNHKEYVPWDWDVNSCPWCGKRFADLIP